MRVFAEQWPAWLSAIATAIAATYAALQFRASRRASQAQLLSTILAEYDSPALRAARRRVATVNAEALGRHNDLAAQDLADFFEIFAFYVQEGVINFRDAIELLGHETLKYHAHLRQFIAEARESTGDKKMYVELENLAARIPRKVKDLKAPSGEDVRAFIASEEKLPLRLGEMSRLGGRSGGPVPADRVYMCMKCEGTQQTCVPLFLEEGAAFPECQHCKGKTSWRATS